MTLNKLAYWIPTALFSLAMTGSGLGALTRQAPLMEAYTHLGYPLYFMTLLGASKLLGVATLLAPGLPRLKEWAYAASPSTWRAPWPPTSPRGTRSGRPWRPWSWAHCC